MTPQLTASWLVVLIQLLCLEASEIPLIWPIPTSVTPAPTGSPALGVSPSFQMNFDASCADHAEVRAAMDRYMKLIFWNGLPTGNPHSAATTLPSLSICVHSSSTDFDYPLMENYTLVVSGSPHPSASINAQTWVGALRGLETFSQLVSVVRDEHGEVVSQYILSGAPLVVRDAPRYPWRGILIDTARHFLPVETIKGALDGMSYSKLNTLHWHMVDAQSFPFSTPQYPLLAKGAYTPKEVYSSTDIQDIVQYAKARGIRVVPEFDVPGHAASWGVGYPDITTNCPNLNANINNIPLSPAASRTLPVLKSVLEHAMSLFPDQFTHIGGDEVVTYCWLNDSAVVAWMAQHGLDRLGTYQYFVDFATQTVTNQGRSTVNWGDPFVRGINVSKDTIIQVWRNQDTVSRTTSNGYRTLVSAPYYLDHQLTWQQYYVADPAVGLDESQSKLVVGGEAAMWGELVDSNNFDARVWPRGAAVAARLWSPREHNDTKVALPLLNAHACRLQQRGLRSGPVAPGSCPFPRVGACSGTVSPGSEVKFLWSSFGIGVGVAAVFLCGVPLVHRQFQCAQRAKQERELLITAEDE